MTAPTKYLSVDFHPVCLIAATALVREVVSASHYIADLTLGLGEVVFDYLAQE